MTDDVSTTAVTTDDAGSNADVSTTTAQQTSVDSNVDGGGTTDNSNVDGGAVTNANDSSQAAPVDGYADFSMPEGVTVDSAKLDAAIPVFKELGLNQDQAQKLVDLEASRVEAAAEAQVEAFNSMVEEWATASKNDSEFGGERFEESVATARAAVDKFGTPELKELLEHHGIGNHPEMIRFMVRVGKLTQEDNPGSSGSPSSAEKDRVSILYG